MYIPQMYQGGVLGAMPLAAGRFFVIFWKKKDISIHRITVCHKWAQVRKSLIR